MPLPRRSVLAGMALLVAGCGVQLRPIANSIAMPSPSKPRFDPRPNPVLPQPSSDPLDLAPGQTVLSLTFDDGRVSMATVGAMMAAHQLAGTFFTNSGNIGKPGYLSLPQLDAIALAGHEIGGHTLTHPDLATLPLDQVRHQVGDDRNQLLDWGYQVRSFAYPFASASPAIASIVHDCGYNSARSLGELRTSHIPENTMPTDNCSQCDPAENVPPGDPYWTKAPAQIKSNWSLDDLQQEVISAQTNGGGWVQLTLHGVCPTDCSDITLPTNEFNPFLDWVVDQQTQGKLIVRTVGDVIGGPVAGQVVV